MPTTIPTASNSDADGLWPAEEYRAEWREHQHRLAGWLMMPFELYSEGELRRWLAVWTRAATTSAISVVCDEAKDIERKIIARLDELDSRE